MPSRVRCFLLTPTDEVELSLRRYRTGRDGPPCHRTIERYPGCELQTCDYHDAEVVVGRETDTLGAGMNGDGTGRDVPLDSVAWPIRCACGYVFTEDDAKQEKRSRLWRRSDNGELVTTSDAPAGALYNADWFDKWEYNRNGAGVSLVLKTPAGEWMIDGPATNGPGWSRTGTPPDIVVKPSIGIGNPQRMHGWLGGPDGKSPGWLVVDKP